MKWFLLVMVVVVCFSTKSYAVGDQELRKGTKIGFVTKSTGVHFDYAILQPMAIGYYPTPNSAISIEYGESSFNFDQYDVFTEFSGSYMQVGFAHRWFLLGGNFNISQTLSQKTMKSKLKIAIEDKENTPFKNSDYTYTEFKDTALLYGIGVGNQWNFKYGLILGVDYVYKQFLLSSTSSHTVTTDSETSSAELTQAANDLVGAENTLHNFQTQTGILLITLGGFF